MRRILFVLLFFPFFIFSQDWIDQMQDPSNNFYDVQRSFNDYWENRTIEKGKGWKQFKRWENFIAPRVFPDGVMRPEILFEEYQNLQYNPQFRMMPPNIWTQIGPDNVPLQGNGDKRGIGRLNTIAFHPTDPDILYVGAPAGGFWKSENAGQTWTTTTDFLTNLGVSDIAVNPSNPDEIFIITGDRDAGDTYGYGLMKSSDGGLTFNTTGLSFNITSYYRGNRVLIDPNNNNIIIVATSNGIYRSTDGGNTFVHTYPSINMTDIEFHVNNSNIIYGASKGNTSIYKSVDNGVNWSQSGNGLPSMSSLRRGCVAVTPDNPSVVYALFGGTDNGYYGVYKSIDEGQTWTEQSTSPNLLGWQSDGSDNGGQAWYDLAFAVDPNDEQVLFVGGVNSWKSLDGGQTWNINTHWYGAGGSTYVHADQHMLKYSQYQSSNNINVLYSCNDGGLYVSYDNGDNWTDISDGLQISQFYSLGVSQTVQDMVITGAQDNGTFLRENNNWDAVIGGDGMECIIDYTNSDIMYGETQYGGMRKSTNGGNSFFSIRPTSNNGAWQTPYIIDRNDPNILYAGYDELYKTTDGGNNWNIITNNETNGGKIDEICVSKSDPNVIYFSDYANIFRTDNGGSNWTNVSNNLPYNYITYIAVHPTNPNKVWVTFSGYNSGEKVYVSYDGGSNWQNISGTLPNIPCNTIVLDENSNIETLYVGTDLGVFTKDSTVSDWSGFNNNSLPNVIVHELEIQYSSNKLMAATYGRGLWSIDLLITSPPSANFFASDSVFCNVPATVDFTNTSYYSNAYYWDFGDGNTSTSTNPSHTYSNYGTYTVSLIANGPLGVDSVIAQSLISIDPSNPCIITLPGSGSGLTQTACNGSLYDVGGPNGNYYDMTDSWVTISPNGSSQVTLDFRDFDIEATSSSSYCNWDYLEIFDGNSLSSPSLGQYCNTLTGSPGVVISTGGAITVFLHADQAVNGRGFALNWTCVYPSVPPVTSFLASDTVSCSGVISFTDLSSNGPTSWLWDFGDGQTSTLQNPTHTYISGGFYTVSLVTSNAYGSDADTIYNYIYVIDQNISATGDSSCAGSTLVLQASSGSPNMIKWYSDSLAQNLVGSGNTFVTPILNNSTTFYAGEEIVFPLINGGPSDNTFGNGGFYVGDRHLVFSNYYPSTLVSVFVYANSAGDRTIQLRNSSNAIIQDTTMFIPYSPNGIRIYLDFDLPVQNNMQLGISGLSDMFRNQDGAVFPYHISNIASITGTNASPGYYYFFYDWEIKKQSCVSDLVSVDAIIYPYQTITQNLEICEGDSIVVLNNIYTSSGNFYDSTACDSIIYTNLTVNPITFSHESTIFCEPYFWNGIIYNSSGTYNYMTTNSNGCDSIATLSLIINQVPVVNNIASICDGDQYIVGNNIYTQTGFYSDTLINGNCDSIVNTSLTVLNNPTYNQTFSICEGDSVMVLSNYYSTNGVFYDTLPTNGCDSIIITQVNVILESLTLNPQGVCQGDSYTIGSSIYSSTGSYLDVFQNVYGCDSTVNTFLTVYPHLSITQDLWLCERDTAIVGNSVYTAPGNYIDSLFSIYGCDSVVYTNIQWSLPSALLSQSGLDLAAQGFGGISPYTYEIYGPNGLISSTQNIGNILYFSPLSNGQYYFVVIDQAGCISDTSFFDVEFVHTSISNIDHNPDLLKVVDVLGRESNVYRNTVLFYIYKDGEIRRNIIFDK